MEHMCIAIISIIMVRAIDGSPFPQIMDIIPASVHFVNRRGTIPPASFGETAPLQAAAGGGRGIPLPFSRPTGNFFRSFPV